MRSGFDKQLTELNREMISMGSLCENAIAMSAKALLDGDAALAKKVSELSAQIERKERDIESMCLKLLLQQQPVAKDLRIISSALKMVTDMERIGHQSSDIAEIISLANISAGGDTRYIHDMALSVIKMVTDSIDAFVKKDAATAKSVILYDDVVDDYFDKIKLALIELFSKPGTDGEQTLDLLMIAKYFERIGDHALNIHDVSKEMEQKKISFSPQAKAEVQVMTNALREILDIAIDAFKNNDYSLADKVEPLEQVIDDLVATIKDKHIKRLQSGNCTIEMGFILSDLLTNYERVSDHCSNIAVLVIEISQDAFDTHKYLNGVKYGDSRFTEEYNKYSAIYHI